MKLAAKHVLSAITGTPWLISEAGLQQVFAVASRQLDDVQAAAAIVEERHEDTKFTTVRGNVGIISVIGAIIPRADLFSEISGATSVERIATDFQVLLDDPDVDTIVMNFDSPGGAITGINEFSDTIRNADKKVIAYVGGQAASAAYWWASACSEVVVDATAMLGSIGVVACVSTKEVEGKLEIANTASPNKRVDLTTAEGKQVLVSTLDDCAQVFIDKVALFRGVTSAQVVDDFGKGGVLVGQNAIDVGMADRLGSYEGLIAELQKEKTTSGGSIMDYAAITEEEFLANRKDLVDIFQAQGQASVSASLEEKEAQIAALQSENDKLKATGVENSDRLAALERMDAIRAEKELALTASAVVADRLTASKLPERMHEKVGAAISADAFVADGKLDEKAFTAHVDTEVSSWEASLGDAVQGLSLRSADRVAATDATDDDLIVARLLGGDSE